MKTNKLKKDAFKTHLLTKLVRFFYIYPLINGLLNLRTLPLTKYLTGSVDGAQFDI